MVLKKQLFDVYDGRWNEVWFGLVCCNYVFIFRMFGCFYQFYLHKNTFTRNSNNSITEQKQKKKAQNLWCASGGLLSIPLSFCVPHLTDMCDVFFLFVLIDIQNAIEIRRFVSAVAIRKWNESQFIIIKCHPISVFILVIFTVCKFT